MLKLTKEMSKPIIVNKFGGGILVKEFIPIMKKRIEEQTKKGYQSIAVVSAMPKVTDEILTFVTSLKENYNEKIIEDFISNLLNRHKQVALDIKISKDHTEKLNAELKKILNKLENELKNSHKNSKAKTSVVTNALEDKLVSYGEKLSAIIMTYYLISNNINAVEFLAEEIPIITDDHFKNANIDYLVSEKNLKNKMKDIKSVIVIPGFTGITKDGEVTTLGRGGTDTTACFVGAALQAEKIILWKDVGGVLSADPKVVKRARTIPFISYLEAEEAGKIIHDKAIQYVKMYKT
ncbi:aspartate kinase, partial [Candidatus Nomurabacteria bacterium]|nr:aspartate kinase [Candidatus Nomurabacteria bacterium]